MIGYICSARIYKYKNFTFEFGYCGPHKLKSDFEPAKCEGRVFWKVINEFNKLSDKKKESYRIGGGCERI